MKRIMAVVLALFCTTCMAVAEEKGAVQRGTIFDRNGIIFAKSDATGMRHYPAQGAASHVVGVFDGSKGLVGLEKSLDKELTMGNSLHLTLDCRLQKIAEKSLATHARSGAVVVIDVASGEVLAAASVPSLPQKELATGVTEKRWQQMVADPARLLINKTVQGAYPPGNPFMLITAFSALENGVIDGNTELDCDGEFRIGSRNYRCWKHNGHGGLGMVDALSDGCNDYFYQLAEKLGIDKLAATAQKFGLGKKTGVGMSYEKAGIVPGSVWRRQHDKENSWDIGNTLVAAIGQGYDLVTPMQMAQMTAIIASGGKQFAPFLVKRITDAEDNIVKKNSPQPVGDLRAEKAYVNLLQEAMIAAKNRYLAVASYPSSWENISFASMRGKGQVVKLPKYSAVTDENTPWKYRDHGWSINYAPVDAPQIVVAVFVEHNGNKGKFTPEIVALEVLSSYFSKK